MLNLIKNNRGVTLIEVLVSAGMTAIVSMGIATMMQNSMQEQRKAVMLDFLKSQKTRFEFLLRDQASWTQTVGSATYNNSTTTGGSMFFEQVRSASAITAIAYTTPKKIVLLDAAGAVAASFLGPSDTTGNGFTEKGAACSTFSTTAGTDACPISYRVMVGAVCPSAGASCANPQLKIVARLLYNPASSGTLNSFRNLIQTIAGTDISDSVADGKYDANVKRTTSSVNRSFRIVAKFSATATGCATGGAGQCSTNNVAPVGALHPVTALTAPNGWSEDYDPNFLVAVAGGSGNITFGETGYYGCMISVPAFATGGFAARLRNITSNVDVASGNTTAGLWGQSTAIIDTKFNVTNTAHVYQIWEKCDALPGGTPSADNCTLGLSPSSAYGTGAQVLISMSCYKLDRSM